jgi:hypothetical protein
MLPLSGFVVVNRGQMQMFGLPLAVRLNVTGMSRSSRCAAQQQTSARLSHTVYHVQVGDQPLAVQVRPAISKTGLTAVVCALQRQAVAQQLPTLAAQSLRLPIPVEDGKLAGPAAAQPESVTEWYTMQLTTPHGCRALNDCAQVQRAEGLKVAGSRGL